MPKIITLKTKGDVSSLINENFNGSETKFLVPDLPKSKQEKLIYLLYNLIDKLEDFEVLHEGKINFGFRNKRIEIVIYKKPILFLGEISDFKKIDKKLLELNEVISNEIQNPIYQDIKIVGCLFSEIELEQNILDSIESLVNNQFLFLNINDLTIFDTIKNYVLSHQ